VSAILIEKQRFPNASNDKITAQFRLVGIGAASTAKTSGLVHLNATVPPHEDETAYFDEPRWPETEEETWTEAKNQLRCDLIDRKYTGTLTPVQAQELARLQALMLRHRQRIAPLPIEDARRLYKELLAEIGDSPAPTDP
jgi:hypothetical protein